MSSAGLEQRIMDRARAEGAALVGIVRIADLRCAPSYAAYDAAPFYPEYEGVEWKEEHKSLVVWGLPHPASEPVLDWWSLKVKGFTPGNRELAAQSKRLRVWVNEELGIGALSAPYQIEYGGAFLKDSAVLAGLGVIGRNNLLITPQFGPRIRLRGLFVEADLEPTPALEGFDPCGACPAPCHRACPKDAFGDARFQRSLCKQEQDQRDVDFEVMDGAVMGVEGPCNVTAYCRECEFACPVARPDDEARTPPARARRSGSPAGERTHFILAEDAWTAFIGRLGGKSAVLAALAAAATEPDPFKGDVAELRHAVLDAADDVAGFACGDPELDDYLAARALAEAADGKTRVAARGDRVAGFSCLKAATVSPPSTIEQEPGQAPLDVPAVLLARLGVDGPEQGQGLGQAMLVMALRRCAQAADTMFARAVLANARSDEQRAFFARYGFEPSPTDAQHVLLRMKDVRKTFKSLQEAEEA